MAWATPSQGPPRGSDHDFPAQGGQRANKNGLPHFGAQAAFSPSTPPGG